MTSATYQPHTAASLDGRPSLVHRVSKMLRAWRIRWVGRAALARMSPAQLRDIGLIAIQAEWEANKAPWQA